MPSLTSPGTRIKLKELAHRPVASVRTCTGPGRLRRTIVLMHDLVMEAVGAQGLAPAGPLFARYHRWGLEIDLEAGVPLAQAIEPVDVVAASSLPAGWALRLLHVGDYATLSTSYEALEACIARHGYRADGGPWECYLVDSSDTPHPDEWRTDIYVPIRTRVNKATLGPIGSGHTALSNRVTSGPPVRLCPSPRHSAIVPVGRGDPSPWPMTGGTHSKGRAYEVSDGPANMRSRGKGTCSRPSHPRARRSSRS